MALDEAMLDSTASHKSLPTLRLYAWQPPCLSLGQAQPAGDVDVAGLVRQGWNLVRRPTGGRAILHTDEITYSIAAPQDEPRVAGTILESYRRLSQALIAALGILGIFATADQQYPVPAGTTPNGAVCFEAPSNYEITVGGKKLIGSAQARRSRGVLQHGSLPLHGDISRITQVLTFDNQDAQDIAARRLMEHALTAETILGKAITWEEAALALRLGFERALDIEFVQDQPSLYEISLAKQLAETKYGADEWTFRV
jgi:lipoate-protein ligase A